MCEKAIPLCHHTALGAFVAVGAFELERVKAAHLLPSTPIHRTVLVLKKRELLSCKPLLNPLED